MSNIVIEEITCPKCGGHLFNESCAAKSMYVCWNKDEQGNICGKTIALCKKCNKIYDEDDFGKHGDVWECKECGTVCWPLTERNRRREECRAELKRMNRELDDFLRGSRYTY